MYVVLHSKRIIGVRGGGGYRDEVKEGKGGGEKGVKKER